jgi:hypothetical protein
MSICCSFLLVVSHGLFLLSLTRTSSKIDESPFIFDSFLVMDWHRWALVKDKEVAQKMIKFIELNTIGVSKDSQLRAAKVLRAVSDGYEVSPPGEASRLFHFSRRQMVERWGKLREVVAATGMFSIPDDFSGYCTFFKETVSSTARIYVPIFLKFIFILASVNIEFPF